ncbi:MAG TPA: gliding motility-associated C-terminal domain-containing protein [Brumimicrobium sp.]|nr:gliding motility-associated C-terminal domain-containing protein [Brumimicrobium sp.]
MNILSLIFTIISAVILSSSFAQTRPPCSNDAAAPGYNACEATPICDFDGYCGRTTPDYKPMSAWHELKKGICDATPMLGGLDCMSLENDGYLKFIASASTISFNIYVYDCKKSGTNAIQVAFFSADNCSSGPVEVHFAEPKLVQQAAPHLITVNNLTPGKVYYILIDGYSGKDCGYTFEAVDGVALPEVKIDIAPNHTVCSGENVVANASGGEENSYLWNDITGGSTFSSTSNTTTTITPPTNPGTYTYSVESTGGNAFCPDNSSDTLTPDEDQFNETFLPIFTSGFDPQDFEMLIFNRWGELIFESHNAAIGWNGKYGEKTVQDGTYIWKIEFKETNSDKRHTLHGHVTLIR